jgi:predicted TIM-barrel fold metal-dependent hydrolase
MVRQAHVLKGTPTLAPAEESTRNQNNMHRRTRIKEMDGHGIQMQVVSWVSPGQLVPPDQALPLTQAANNRLAGAIAANPTRLSGFAALPWQEPRAAAAELDRSVSELGLKGALILGRPGETFLDDPRYAPVLQKLSDLQVPLYVHPFSPVPQVHEAYYSGFSPLVTAEFSLGAWGWHNEAGIHVLRLILSGTFEKFPDLQVISGHWGEMVPFYLQRLDDVMPPKVTGLSGTVSEIYRRHVWVTPSGMFGLPHFDFIHKVIGADRIIWSVDYPFLTLDGTREFLENLTVSEDDREKMAYRNAENLFNLDLP